MIHIISLGEYCAVANILKKLNTREASYPFDWIYSSLEKNVLFIKEMLSSKSIDNVYNKYISFDYDNNINTYINKFSYSFPHELSITSDEFKDKSKRRIQRLYDIILSNEKILFVFSNRNDKIEEYLLIDLIETILKINKNCKLLVFHGDLTLQVSHPNIYLEYYFYPKCRYEEYPQRDITHQNWMGSRIIKFYGNII